MKLANKKKSDYKRNKFPPVKKKKKTVLVTAAIFNECGVYII